MACLHHPFYKLDRHAIAASHRYRSAFRIGNVPISNNLRKSLASFQSFSVLS
jgi:hypothetical protein